MVGEIRDVEMVVIVVCVVNSGYLVILMLYVLFVMSVIYSMFVFGVYFFFLFNVLFGVVV